MLLQRLAATSRVEYEIHSPFSCKPIAFRRSVPVAAARARITRQRIHAFLGAPRTLTLHTIKAPYGQGTWKANVVLPPSVEPAVEAGKIKDDKITVKARGVVLFMHGFVQDPTAYALMLTQLAKHAGVLVVAPCPDASADTETQQGNMVDAALFWHHLIVEDKLPGMKLGDTAKRVGLMGHSVGGGLAPYVVHAAANGLLHYAAAPAADGTAAAAADAAGAQSANARPFFAAHVMAPQTGKVVDRYRYDVAAGGQLLKDVGTVWGVQYGRIDMLSPARSVEDFCIWLQGRTYKDPASVPYLLGTHVGFEDQLVVNGKSFSDGFLGWLLAVLWGLLAGLMPGPTLRALSFLSGGTNLRAAAPPAAQQKRLMAASASALPAAFGPDDFVALPNEWAMLTGYASLALAVTRLAIIIPFLPWSWLSVAKAALLALAAYAGSKLLLLPARPQADAAQRQQPPVARPRPEASPSDEGPQPAGHVRRLALIAAAAAALAMYIPGLSCASNWAALAPVLAAFFKVLCCVLALFAWPALAVYPYEAWVQRPDARAQVVAFFDEELEKAGAPAGAGKPQGAVPRSQGAEAGTQVQGGLAAGPGAGAAAQVAP